MTEVTRIEPGGRAVLFAFDDRSIPWRYRLRLEMHRPEKYDGNPVIARGPSGAADERRAENSPVIHDGERFRMWYIARDDGAGETAPGERERYNTSRGGRGGISEIGTTGDIVHSYDTGRICCAESDDGYHWHKPDLGIVEYRGSTHNNICDLEPGTGSMDVLFQPDAPPARRYLMVIEFTAWRHLKKPPPLEMASITRFAASPDGYRWTMLQEEPGVVGQHHEVFCLYRYRDRYHIAGHQASPLLYLPLQRHRALPYCGPRTMVVWRSPDVDRWPLETCHAFFKPMQSSSPYRTGWDREEVHMGAYVTPYPNVCLGVCGQWHHPITGAPERPDYRGEEVAVDLGFILSNDGVHFREPAPGFTFVGRDQELSWDRDWRDNTTRDRMLEQGPVLMEQGPLLNIGDRTVLYYTACTPHGNLMGSMSNIGMATLPRERFGSLTPVDGADYGQAVTDTIQAASAAQLCANVELPPGGRLEAALTDPDGLAELPGYELDASRALTESGLAQRLTWRDRPALPAGAFRIRIRLTAGSRLYALYVEG